MSALCGETRQSLAISNIFIQHIVCDDGSVADESVDVSVEDVPVS